MLPRRAQTLASQNKREGVAFCTIVRRIELLQGPCSFLKAPRTLSVYHALVALGNDLVGGANTKLCCLGFSFDTTPVSDTSPDT